MSLCPVARTGALLGSEIPILPLSPQGELPLNAIQVLFEENDKTSFLIEGGCLAQPREARGWSWGCPRPWSKQHQRQSIPCTDTSRSQGVRGGTEQEGSRGVPRDPAQDQQWGRCFPGRLINSIRVTCASYQDYQEWLYCLKTAQFRNADSSLSGSESFSGSKPPHPSQVRGAAALGGNPWLSHLWPHVALLWHSCGTAGSAQSC